MVKQATKKEWVYWFKRYESTDNYYRFFIDYSSTLDKPFNTVKRRKNTRERFRSKFAL